MKKYTSAKPGKKERHVKRDSRIGAFYKGLSHKRKVLFVCISVVLVLTVAGGIFMAVKPDAPVEVSAVDVVSSDIQQTITVSGTVSSSSQSVFTAIDGINVKEVNVALGDAVQQGQVLATFDTNGLSEKLDAKQQAYTQSQHTYDESVKQSEQAREQLPVIEARIAELQAQVELEGSTEATQSGLEKLLNSFSLDKLTEMFSSIGSGFDMASMLGSQYSDAEQELIELQAKKVVLESQSSNTMQSVYKQLVDSTKKAYEDYKLACDSISAGWTAEQAGVVTKMNLTAGQVFSVADAAEQADITQIISLLQSGVSIDSLLSGVSSSDTAAGIVVDNYSGFYADFNINQYDVSKVTIGQSVNVSAVNNPTAYTGTVSYISPTMSTSSASFDIGSIASSLTGGSSSSGLDAKVSLTNPDKGMIIGMPVDMDINTSFVAGAISVPIEAIYLEGSDVSVFVIEDGRVYKKPLEVGISSNTMYQVISGCNVGDVLVKNPTSTLVDGARVKIKAE